MNTNAINNDIPYFEDSDNKIIPGQKIVERDVAHVFVFDPRTQTALSLVWKEFGWKAIVIGGLEGAEDPIQAGQRELAEETGYSNVKYIATLGKTRNGFYALNKKENRIANATGVLYELVDDSRQAVEAEETARHVAQWVPAAEFEGFLTFEPHKYLWRQAVDVLKEKGLLQ